MALNDADKARRDELAGKGDRTSDEQAELDRLNSSGDSSTDNA